MRFYFRVNVRLKSDILDTQGKAILQTLHNSGNREVTDLRCGKQLELEIDAADAAAAQAVARDVSGSVLSNPLIETFELEAFTPEALSPAAKP